MEIYGRGATNFLIYHVQAVWTRESCGKSSCVGKYNLSPNRLFIDHISWGKGSNNISGKMWMTRTVQLVQLVEFLSSLQDSLRQDTVTQLIPVPSTYYQSCYMNTLVCSFLNSENENKTGQETSGHAFMFL